MSKEMDIKINKISKQLLTIVVQNVNEQVNALNSKYEYLNDFIEDINDRIKNAEEQREQLSQDKLTLNALEMEGYRRALIDVKTLMDRYGITLAEKEQFAISQWTDDE